MTRCTRLTAEALDDRCLPSFSPAVNYPVGSSPAAVVTGDFNNDGHLDLVSASTNSVGYRPGDGSGGFGEVINSAAASAANNTQDRSLAVGDFNADGNLDLAMVNDYMLGGWNGNTYTPEAEDSNGVSVMLGNGDGSFQTPLNVPTYQGDKATSVAVGDFNADGTMDLAVAATRDPYYPGDVYIDSGLASVLLGNGDGSFHIQDGRWVDLGYAWPNYPPAAASVAVADFNGDGTQDFVVGTRGYETGGSVELVAMLLGDGHGNIASVSHWRLDHGWSMAAGDLNGDGDADLVTATGSQVRVRLGNGTGGFEAPAGGQSYAAGPGASEVVLGDFNRDGKLDIATANYIGGNVSVLRGRGDGTFSEAEFYSAGPGAIAVAAGDLNGDGWLDVVTANAGGNTTSVLINDQSWGAVPPHVSVSDTTVTEGDAGTVNATFTLTLSRASAVDVTVQYSTADVTATAGSDYVAASGTVTIPAGQTSKTFTVAVKGDLVAELNEQFAVNLTAATNATIRDGQGVVTILDDEPRVSIGNAQVTEGNTGTTNATFTVTLTKVSPVDVTVQYQTLPYGTATAGSDYVATSGTVTVPAGQTNRTFTVAVLGDRQFESNETFYVALTGVTNAIIANGWGIGTILDDEPRVGIGDVTKKEGRRGQTAFTFTVTLSAAYDQPVTVNFATADGTATLADNDYVAASGTLTFAPGETSKTVTVWVNGDRKRETNETFYLLLSEPSSNALILDAQGVGTILNDD
jgi:hypothetical protein